MQPGFRRRTLLRPGGPARRARRAAGRAGLLAVALLALPLGCGSGDPPSVDSPPWSPAEGLYEVHGLTTVKGSGEKRRITGPIVMRKDGDAWTMKFSLSTQWATRQGPIEADLIGDGRGHMQQRVLSGDSETQIIFAAIPGLDPRFPFAPGRLGPILSSRFEMVPGETPGEYLIEIESSGGSDYPPTRTTLRATHVPGSLDLAKDERLPLPEPHDD